MNDRRRVNGPPGGTAPPIFTLTYGSGDGFPKRPRRTRNLAEPRKIFLKTGLTPSASGSAYLELNSSISHSIGHSREPNFKTLLPPPSSLKLTCAVHGPRPLPRSSPFTPYIVLSTHVKFTSFSTRKRRGYLRDNSERDLAAHLETALRGVIIGDRWPKSSVEVVITILEGEDDRWWYDEIRNAGSTAGEWGLMSVLAGCITVASAALADAGIDCVDLISGGVAAVVRQTRQEEEEKENQLGYEVILDPAPSEHSEVVALCVVGYLAARDEITEIWTCGAIPKLSGMDTDKTQQLSIEGLTEKAIEAAVASRLVLGAAIKEFVELKAK